LERRREIRENPESFPRNGESVRQFVVDNYDRHCGVSRRVLDI
jgi:hypothetical protein